MVSNESVQWRIEHKNLCKKNVDSGKAVVIPPPFLGMWWNFMMHQKHLLSILVENLEWGGGLNGPHVNECIISS